jgi:hypothetical protein
VACGDAQSHNSYSLLMDGKLPHVVFTDVPYNLAAHLGDRTLNDSIAFSYQIWYGEGRWRGEPKCSRLRQLSPWLPDGWFATLSLIHL